MLYTIGIAEDYDRMLAKNPATMKQGRDDNYFGVGRGYAGGAAYLSYDEAAEEARKHANRGLRLAWKVYGLMTTAENTYIAEDGSRRIIKGALVVQVPKSMLK